MKTLGIDVGSTTVKAVLAESDRLLWQAYRRHHTKQAETVLEFLEHMEKECALQPGRDVILFTGSGSGFIAPLVGGRFVQEVVAVAAAVERFHPHVNFVSEIGGEDMKTIFFTTSANGKSKQVYMQSACSGGTGTFIEKTARKLNVTPESLARMNCDGLPLHKISSKCGIFAEADANTLIKGGVTAEEVVASLFEAVVYQNLATLTKGNTPLPEVLLLGGPNLFFKGLQQAWRRNLAALWADRRIVCDRDADALIHIPAEALYYASLGCIEIAKHSGAATNYYSGTSELRRWIEHGQHEEKAKQGGKALVSGDAELEGFLRKYVTKRPSVETPLERSDPQESEDAATPVLVGCDFGSTTAKAVVLAADKTLLFSCYAPSRGNPIEDAKDLLRQIRQAGFESIGALALTGYGKDLLNDILGADVSVVETVAHARAALHFFPDADVICDVGGCDIKVMILRNGTVADFRLNSQCSSGNGAFLQGVAERYGVPLENYAERAFRAKSLPQLAMGCGVFLQSDIVNQQRKGWSADEIMASLAAVLPLNVWVYACQLQNLRAVGRKFVLQGGTHRNAAVVKAQVDFITGKVPDAEIVIHPYSGEAGAIGAALCAGDAACGKSRFRGFAAIEALTYRATTNDQTICHWCSCNCKRTFIDVQLLGAAGRPWSKIPVPQGFERVISGNSCPKGLVEDVNEMRTVKARIEEAKRAYPNVAEMVRATAFRRA
jgi:predicted CoA-substrate-specific enzyme activase